MHVIDARFECLDEVPVATLFGAIGVYVLWSSRADVRPSYIGEGNFLQRFASEHVERFGIGMAGYAAIMHAGTQAQRKRDAEMVEAALLHVGERLDQAPPHNISRGKYAGFERLYQANHNVVRINVSGYHPLRWDTRLQGRACIRADFEEDEWGVKVMVEHPWRRSSV